MTTYAIALYWLSPLLAVLFWLAAVWLWRISRRQGQLHGRLSIVIWCVHAAIWWTVSAALRWANAYTGPTLWMSAWGSALYVHCAVGVLQMAYLLDREDQP